MKKKHVLIEKMALEEEYTNGSISYPEYAARLEEIQQQLEASNFDQTPVRFNELP